MEAGVTAPAVTYQRFDFRRVDAMGFGRFTYASAPIDARVKLVER